MSSIFFKNRVTTEMGVWCTDLVAIISIFDSQPILPVRIRQTESIIASNLFWSIAKEICNWRNVSIRWTTFGLLKNSLMLAD